MVLLAVDHGGRRLLPGCPLQLGLIPQEEATSWSIHSKQISDSHRSTTQPVLCRWVPSGWLQPSHRWESCQEKRLRSGALLQRLNPSLSKHRLECLWNDQPEDSVRRTNKSKTHQYGSLKNPGCSRASRRLLLEFDGLEQLWTFGHRPQQ